MLFICLVERSCNLNTCAYFIRVINKQWPASQPNMIKPTHYLQVQVLLALSRWANCSELSTLYQSEDNLSKPKKNYWNLLDNSMNVIWHAWQIELVSASQQWSHPTSGARASTYRSYHGRYIWLLGIVCDKWNKNEDISQIRLALSYYYTQINKKKHLSALI